jgi:serine/threonine protein kinase/tetratricopeptide (TPR) repeat protein
MIWKVSTQGDIMIGKSISHYRIIKKLGEGGMGEVYLAEDTKLDRRVALKFLPKEFTRDKEARERFKREAKAAAALNHQNIVTIYEINEHEGQTYIAMENIDGQTLKELMTNNELPITQVIDITTQICEGLTVAHKAGIIHRDIKPQNILLNQEGRVKILDFGLAKLKGVSQITKETSTLGTVHYLSPEQALRKEMDQHTDIWSLGVLLYEMLTGQLPFKGEYDQAVIYSILNEEPEKVTAYRQDLLTGWDRIIGKALKKSPSERYQNIRDLEADVRSVKAGLEKEKRRTSSMKPSKRKVFYLVDGLVILVAVLALAKIFLFKAPAGEVIDSIAVLPFQNLSADPDQEYFSDGMTEALITELSKIKALRVISRTSVMGYKKTEKPLPKIAKELNVTAIIEGSVQRAQDEVRITAQLIRAVPEKHIWANSFTKNFKNILALESDVAQAIAKEINITMTAEEQQQLASSRSVDPEAYEAYLKGRFFINKFNETDVRRGMSFFDQAIARDSSYALAYEGLAEGYDMLVSLGGISSEDGISKMRTWARKALSIDQTLAAAYTIIGEIGCYEWNWQSAEENYRQAIELNQNYAAGHAYYAFYLSLIKRYDESVSEAKQAVELDPLWPMTKAILAYALFYDHQYENAMTQVNDALNIDSTFAIGYAYRGCFYLWQEDFEEAIVQFQKAIAFGDYPVLAFLAYTYARSGNMMKVREILVDSKKKYIQPALFGLVYIGLGDWDLAFEYMEKAYEEKDSYLLVCVSIPEGFDTIFDRFRMDPRFTAILKKMRLGK